LALDSDIFDVCSLPLSLLSEETISVGMLEALMDDDDVSWSLALDSDILV
jgi:hypothetical protein